MVGGMHLLLGGHAWPYDEIGSMSPGGYSIDRHIEYILDWIIFQCFNDIDHLLSLWRILWWILYSVRHLSWISVLATADSNVSRDWLHFWLFVYIESMRIFEGKFGYSWHVNWQLTPNSNSTANWSKETTLIARQNPHLLAPTGFIHRLLQVEWRRNIRHCNDKGVAIHQSPTLKCGN